MSREPTRAEIDELADELMVPPAPWEIPRVPLTYEAARAIARRRLRAKAAAELPPGSGPQPLTSAAEIEATRQRLEAEGKPHGERSIARELSVSRDAVRYALGKDRRR
jgi:hypothetical protein